MATDDPQAQPRTIDREGRLSPRRIPVDGGELDKSNTIRTIGILKLRGKADNLPRSWWFASTAVPLLAATQGPLSNVLSIAALVTTWRVTLPNNGQLPEGADDNGFPKKDPGWELALNGVSLACGFAGNFLLLLHFVGRIRYIVALPLSIILWLLASVILIAITASVSIYTPAVAPGETYSQGFWHAVIASITYMIGAVMLMANLIGYLLGHYPQNFVLDDDQRTLILQTIMFFAWLAGGAAVFSSLEGWSFDDALYYCDILIGITQLGLVISRISRYMSNISADNVIKRHQARARENTVGRSVTNEAELRERLGLPQNQTDSIAQQITRRNTLTQYGKFKIVGNTVTFKERNAPVGNRGAREHTRSHQPLTPPQQTSSRSVWQIAQMINSKDRRRRLLILKEERDRFNAMREIQDKTRRFKQYYTLIVALFTFALLWALGALVFLYAEKRVQDMDYFDSFYFCFVTLLTVGYGDISPKSNAGKAFFIVWSLIAVPTITVLIQALSDTVVAGVNRATNVLLPEKGFIKAFIHSNPNHWFTRLVEHRQQKKRVDAGFQIQDPEEAEVANDNAQIDSQEKNEVDTLSRVEKDSLDEHHLARQLATAIRSVARDLRADPPKRYSYTEWVHFTKLIRFSSGASREAVEAREEEEGLVEWDWIGEDSPMLAESTESEWVLDRLCESLHRYTRRHSHRQDKNTNHPGLRYRVATHEEATDGDQSGLARKPEFDEDQGAIDYSVSSALSIRETST
ncbi:hypothetical protein F5Y19DRAFT_467913 [Xylariaceae sp. FL1651]|nr:hypothetical protein F5Y19DRAFT_467913 [Xylariaceae sp. FL1651]